MQNLTIRSNLGSVHFDMWTGGAGDLAISGWPSSAEPRPYNHEINFKMQKKNMTIHSFILARLFGDYKDLISWIEFLTAELGPAPGCLSVHLWPSLTPRLSSCISICFHAFCWFSAEREHVKSWLWQREMLHNRDVNLNLDCFSFERDKL